MVENVKPSKTDAASDAGKKSALPLMKAKVVTLENYTGNDPDSTLTRHYQDTKNINDLSDSPPFPRHVMFELSNICNHACTFCGYTDAKRKKGLIDPDRFKSLAQQAFDSGGREISLVGGAAEPLANKRLEEYIQLCSDLGYDYIYITTNATLADEDRWKRIIDAGIHSIKVSINGGTRNSYLAVHGKDHFDRAIGSIHCIDKIRKSHGKEISLSASFVECAENAGTFENLKKLVGSSVDEILFSPALKSINVNNWIGDPDATLESTLVGSGKIKCFEPFNRVTFSLEGYMKACCMDRENLLLIEDTDKISVKEAWRGTRFKEFRRRHIAEINERGNLKGLFCNKCLYADMTTPYAPLSPERDT